MAFALGYALVGLIWVGTGDLLVERFVADSRLAALIELAKGWAFVLLGAALLYLLVQRMGSRCSGALGELRRTMEAKAHSERLLKELLDASPDSIYVKDRMGRYQLFNREVARLTGRGADEVLGQGDKLLFPDDQAGRLRASDLQVMSGNRVVSLEETLSTVDGERTYLTIKGPLHAADGSVNGLFGISRDITERKQAENELRLWARAFRHAGFAMAISDAASNTFLAVNPAYAEERGYAPEELIGQSLAILYAPEEYARIQARLAGVDLTVHGQLEVVQRRKDGSTFPALLDVTVMHDEEGRPGSRVVLSLDLTLRQRAEAALRRAREQLEIFVRAAPLAMAMLDRDLRYVAWSDRWLAEYGRGRADLGGVSHYDVIPDVPQVWREVHQRALAGQAIREEEDHWVQADGSRHWLRWSVSPWSDADGAVGGIVISAEDITELILARAELARLRGASEADAIPKELQA